MKRRMRALFFTVFLVIAPPLVAVIFTLGVWAHATWMHYGGPIRYAIRPTFSKRERIEEAVRRAFDMLSNSGWGGGALLAVKYLFSCGLLIALSIFATRRWNTARVICFSLCGTLVLLGFSYPKDLLESGVIIGVRYGGIQYGQVGIDGWDWYLISYPWYALPLALTAGGLMALLPIFRPSKRYWLRRGMCPKCHYDLKHEIDKGCPECGWNRPPAEQTQKPAST